MFFLSESGPAHRVLGVCIDKYAKSVCRHVCEVSLIAISITLVSRGELPVAHPSRVSYPPYISKTEDQMRQVNDLGGSVVQEKTY